MLVYCRGVSLDREACSTAWVAHRCETHTNTKYYKVREETFLHNAGFDLDEDSWKHIISNVYI